MIIFVNADGGRFRRRMQRFEGCAHLFRVDTPGQGNLNDGYSYELLESCKKGDRKAQKSLYDLLAPKMMALCMRYAGSRELAGTVFGTPLVLDFILAVAVERGDVLGEERIVIHHGQRLLEEVTGLTVIQESLVVAAHS